MINLKATKEDLRDEVLSMLPDKSQTGQKMIAFAIMYLAETIKANITCSFGGQCGYKKKIGD